MLRPVTAVMLMVCLAPVSAIAPAADDLERLSDIADEDFAPIDRALDRPPFYHAKALSVTKDSLASGWVSNHQCHRHFSATPTLEIVFPSDKIRSITISDSTNLGAVEVRGHTLHLKDVNARSVLCFNSENLLLQRELDGTYRITAGPFYYRFLDGYFPMEVDLIVRYPASLLEVLRVNPDNQRGVEVTRTAGKVRFQSRFEGTLWVHVYLKRK